MRRTPLFYACSCAPVPLKKERESENVAEMEEGEMEEKKSDVELNEEEMKEQSNHLTVSFLLKHGADVTLKDSGNLTLFITYLLPHLSFLSSWADLHPLRVFCSRFVFSSRPRGPH